jgi:serine/threonine protein kinase
VNSREDIGDVISATWLAGRYQIAGLRARGTLSLVYQGQDAVLQRPVAIKAPLADHIAAYRATLDLTASLAHPAFLALYDAIEHDGHLFLAYEFVEGRSLTDYIADGLPVRRAVALVLQITRALAYAHARGVAHGDLTPAAIIVDRTAVARVANVGLTPDGMYFDELAEIAFRSEIADNPEVTAPALVEPRIERLDVWAVAAMLWQLVTDVGQSENPERTSVKQIREFRADVPQQVRDVIERTLRVNHSDPIMSAEALESEIAALDRAIAMSAVDHEYTLPVTLSALRARKSRARTDSGVAHMGSGLAGIRWSGAGVNGALAAATATTSYDDWDRDIGHASDPYITNPADDGRASKARPGEGSENEMYVAQAPRLNLPTLSPRQRSLRARAAPPSAGAGEIGLGGWLWALISLAVFVLCFLAGFLLEPVFTFVRWP